MIMTTSETQTVRSDIAELVADVFQYDGLITLATSPDEIATWDSLQHVALIRSIEETFDVSLSMDEMMEIRSVADIGTVLARYGV